MNEPLVIGTRGSGLALWQARQVESLLPVPSRIEIIRTSGDRFLDVPLQGRMEKGFFTKEIEDALLEGRIDLAVHSLKDLPVEMPPGLALGACLTRGPAPDLLLVNPSWSDETRTLPLKEGCLVGATSLRRQALLKLFDPAAKPDMLRGNVPTRVEKLKSGQYGAIVLAEAGVHRLELDLCDLMVYRLDPEWWLPAPGQAVVAVQVRQDDPRVSPVLPSLHHGPSAREMELERTALRNFGGGCHTAFGARARQEGGAWRLDLGLDDAGAWLRASFRGGFDELLRVGPDNISDFNVLTVDEGMKPWQRLSR